MVAARRADRIRVCATLRFCFSFRCELGSSFPHRFPSASWRWIRAAIFMPREGSTITKDESVDLDGSFYRARDECRRFGHFGSCGSWVDGGAGCRCRADSIVELVPGSGGSDAVERGDLCGGEHHNLRRGRAFDSGGAQYFRRAGAVARELDEARPDGEGSVGGARDRRSGSGRQQREYLCRGFQPDWHVSNHRECDISRRHPSRFARPREDCCRLDFPACSSSLPR